MMSQSLTVEGFRQSLTNSQPPANVSNVLQALWHEAKGDWSRAHDILQHEDSANGAWVHAYLHRVEGDLGNAAYWYRRADKPVSQASLADEWNELVGALLAV
jgi:hypothetical protein